MKLPEVPKGSAIMVSVTALSEINLGDDVLLGIRCRVTEKGLIPYNQNLQIFRKQLNDEIGNKVIIVKHDKSGL